MERPSLKISCSSRHVFDAADHLTAYRKGQACCFL